MHGNLRLTLLALLILSGSPCLAGSEKWASVTGLYTLSFTAQYEDQPLSGHFERLKVEATADENTGNPVSLLVRVDVTSADMNDREINEELVQADWFDSGKFPEAVFRSRDIVQPAGGGHIARGTLVLKGIEQALDVPFVWQQEDENTVIGGSLVLSRLNWQVGLGEWEDSGMIADDVEVRFQVVLNRAD